MNYPQPNDTPTFLITWDMDSCLIPLESLDKLVEEEARTQLGLEGEALEAFMKRIEAITNQAMEGDSGLTETIPARIAAAKDLGVIIKQEHFKTFAETLEPCDGIREVLDNLQEAFRGKAKLVYAIVSGGPSECVGAVGTQLGIHIGKGNKIIVEEGIVNVEDSDIVNAKDPIIAHIKTSLASLAGAIHIGDGTTDLEVQEASQVIKAEWSEPRPGLRKQFPNTPVAQDMKQLEDFISKAIDQLLKEAA